MVKNMTELDRVKGDFEQSVKNIVSARAEDEKVSLEILSHAAVEIALELAILNDYLKGEDNVNKDYQEHNERPY